MPDLRLAGAFVSAAEVERELREIFKDPAYSGPPWLVEPAGGAAYLLRNLSEAVKSYFRALQDFFASLYIQSPLLFWLTVCGIILCSLLLLYHTTRMVLRALRAEPLRTAPGPEHSGGRRREAQMLLEKSGALAGEGRYGEAVRYLFLALLRALSETRYRTVPAGWTNHEIIAALEVPAELRGRLIDVVEAFDHGWYGREEVASDLYVRCRGAVVDFLRAIEARASMESGAELSGAAGP